MLLIPDIRDFFKKHNLALTKPNQTIKRSDSVALVELRKLADKYEKEQRVPIYFKCQSSINDCIVIFQKYYKDNKKEYDSHDAENGAT